MKDLLRKWAWKFLGNKYYQYLKGKNTVWLKDAQWAVKGKHTYDNGAYVWRWHKGSTLEIGSYGAIAANVHFVCDPGYHTESQVTSFPLFHEIADKSQQVSIDGKSYRVSDIAQQLRPQKSGIRIGHDAWIGINATILPGVNIGNGVTILPGAVVSKDLPHYAIAGGVPAEVVRLKHRPEIITALNAIAWWNWPDEKVRACLDDFYLPMEDFIKKHG